MSHALSARRNLEGSEKLGGREATRLARRIEGIIQSSGYGRECFCI
jgi:hypothetical protein